VRRRVRQRKTVAGDERAECGRRFEVLVLFADVFVRQVLLKTTLGRRGGRIAEGEQAQPEPSTELSTTELYTDVFDAFAESTVVSCTRRKVWAWATWGEEAKAKAGRLPTRRMART
jgi:hypothetical protein